MGGKAFSQLLPRASFPRMSPSKYQSLKATYLPRLRGLYGLVEVPREAPEKTDHGDLDFIVAFPKEGLEHSEVKAALGASASIPLDGNRTSHFAVPAEMGEDEYIQVDVHVCADKEEWERIVLFHSFGDLGMILGVLAKSGGLQLGTKGLKVHNIFPEENHPVSFPLSASFEKIMPYFGLSLDTWKQGFSSQKEIFQWVETSRFFEPRRLVKASTFETPNAKERSLEDRGMYQSFLVHVREIASQQDVDTWPRLKTKAEIRDEALTYFDKKEAYERLVHDNWVKARVRATWNGNKVIEWTGLWGLRVRELMQEVERRVGGKEGIAGMEDGEIKKTALEAHETLKRVWAAAAVGGIEVDGGVIQQAV
ncbi:hypothetical protein JAAARDRAFT_30349 [Jaapia argillacea MUCL 33604]|uniref:Uncharacterized protein n=1 Tax=Jaapia argillacea MUCL 33604 TaxID=933084 RepID=A0A067Q667_9AGAM|nr:hypothetical protein JAAARDRAFT_30349 [Jaapia argillacea MUCL 33604]